MRAITVRPPEKGFKVEELDFQKFSGPGLRIKLLENGICGTDREIVGGLLSAATTPKGYDRMILGHEAIGVLEEDGKTLKKGDLVMPVNRRGCGECLNCLMGRPDFCETGRFTEAGIIGMHGFMRDAMVDSEEFLVPVPQAIKKFAILAQPLSDLEKSVAEILYIQGRMVWTCRDGTYNCRKALVIGTGPVGILISLLLRSYGFSVYAANKRVLSEKEGKIFEVAGITYINGGKDLIELRNSGKTFDVVIEASGSDADIISGALKLIRNNGLLGIFGFSSIGSTTMSSSLIQSMVYKSVTIVGLINGQKPHFQMAMHRLAQWNATWPEIVGSLITKEISISDVDGIAAALQKKENGEIKVKIKW